MKLTPSSDDPTLAELVKNSVDLNPPHDPAPGHKWVKNLMTDRWVEIPIETPVCCDPSFERYWCM